VKEREASASDRRRGLSQSYDKDQNLFPKGELVPHEKPDFLLHRDSRTIGIEVTELCREEPRAEGGRLAKIPEKAKARYGQLGTAEPVDVSLAFSRHAASVSFEQLTNSLVEFVYARRESKGISPTRDLPEGYCHIGIHPPLETFAAGDLSRSRSTRRVLRRNCF
jgi:hypothetical protein